MLVEKNKKENNIKADNHNSKSSNSNHVNIRKNSNALSHVLKARFEGEILL